MFQEAVFTAKAYTQKKHLLFFLRTKFCRMAQRIFIVEAITVKKGFQNQSFILYLLSLLKGSDITSFKQQEYPSSMCNLLLETATHFIQQNIYTYGETKPATLTITIRLLQQPK